MKKLSLILIFMTGAMLNLKAQHQHSENSMLKAGKISGHSLFHLNAGFETHRGEEVQLKDFAGSPLIVVMFYGNCTQVCPILIQDTWRLYSEVDENLREQVNVLAVSFDTENDTPEVLREYAKYEQLDIEGWHFAVSGNANVRSLAMMLGVQYNKEGDGEFAHSNLVSVLDGKGNIVKRVEGLNQPMKEAAEHIEELLKSRN